VSTANITIGNEAIWAEMNQALSFVVSADCMLERTFRLNGVFVHVTGIAKTKSIVHLLNDVSAATVDDVDVGRNQVQSDFCLLNIPSHSINTPVNSSIHVSSKINSFVASSATRFVSTSTKQLDVLPLGIGAGTPGFALLGWSTVKNAIVSHFGTIFDVVDFLSFAVTHFVQVCRVNTRVVIPISGESVDLVFQEINTLDSGVKLWWYATHATI
jgi:hypothetical protein